MLKSVVVFVLAAIVLFAPQNSWAGSKNYKERLEAIQENHSVCMNKADTTAAMHACLNESHGKLDTLLNESYRALRKAVEEDKAYHAALRTEQLAWIKLRDAVLKNISERGGTIASVNAGDAANQLISNRIELFVYLLLTLQGDEAL